MIVIEFVNMIDKALVSVSSLFLIPTTIISLLIGSDNKMLNVYSRTGIVRKMCTKNHTIYSEVGRNNPSTATWLLSGVRA